MQAFIISEKQAYQESLWQPPADIYRIDRGWLVKLDLAGVRREDIHLNVRGKHLIVEGLRRDWVLETGQQYYSMEIAYNRFKRLIELPTNLERARIATEYRDGMLLIWLEMEA
jgi:HSP20 family protein